MRARAVIAVGLLWAPLAAAQPTDLEAWTTVRSENFEMHSDADPDRAVEIVASLERFRSVFADLAPELELRSPAPTQIFAFRDAESFAPYKSGAEGNGVKILGQFLTHRDGNYITLNADPRYLGSFSVIFHEYVHFLVQSNFPGVPRWFNEGLAEYYSTFLVEGETVYLGQPVERHMRWLRANSELELESVLETGSREARGHDASGAGRFYAVSWILVHQLLSDSSDRSEALAGYFADLARGEDSYGAFVDAFGIRPSELEERLISYVGEAALPVAALAIEDLSDPGRIDVTVSRPHVVLAGLGELLAHMGREEVASHHVHAALEYAPESGDAYATLAYIRDRQQRLVEAHSLWEQAMELEPTRAVSYVLYGRHLMTLSQGGGLIGDGSDRAPLADSARWALDVATGLDPQFGEAWVMRGVSHLLPGGEPSEGVSHLERARALLPGRVDVLSRLVELYLRNDQSDAAVALVEGELSRVATPEEVAAANEEIERWGLVSSANEAFQDGEAETGLRLFDQAISVTSDPELRLQMEERLEHLRERFEGRR